MRTKRKPKSEPDANQGSTWGVRYLHRPERPLPYGVQWPEKVWDEAGKAMVRKVKTLFFPTQEAREIKAVELRNARRGRMMVASVSRDEMDEFRAFKAAIGTTPWQDVVAGWRSRQIESGIRSCELTVDEAVKTYVAQAQALREKEKISKDYFRHLKTKTELFADQFGDLMLDKVPTVEIVAWIDDFDEVQSDFTFDCYKKHIRTFFNYFVKEVKAIRENPASRIKDRSDGIGDVGILTVPQAAQLFWTAYTFTDPDGTHRYRRILGRLALEAFIGLRFSSGCRLEKTDINFDDKGVLLPKRKLKTKRRHYIDGLPENVWTWLAVTTEDCWDLTARNYMRLKSELFATARVPHPHNCLRHSFATYHVAAYKDAGKTAYLLCHRNQDELYEHYKGNAKEEAGRTYWTLTPQSVERLREGFEPVPDANASTRPTFQRRSPA